MARKSKYSKNDTFFRVPSRAMWYVIGVLAGDGDISAHNNSISLEWKIDDYNHLITIKNFLSKEVPAKIRQRKGKEYCRFFIFDSQLHDDIISLGVPPKKSFTLRLPDIPLEYFWDFTRGMFDADGSISKVVRKIKPSYPRFKITNNQPFLEQLGSAIEERLDIKFPKLYIYPKSSHPTVKTADLKISGTGAMKVFDAMYHNCPEDLKLNRKYNIYKEWTKDNRYVKT